MTVIPRVTGMPGYRYRLRGIRYRLRGICRTDGGSFRVS